MSSSSLRELVDSGAPFIDLVEFIRSRKQGRVTPFEVLAALQNEAMVSFVDARDVLEYFDSEMHPIADTDAIQRRWAAILAARGGSF
ncbi:hypothetical protein WBG06_26385 [Nocardioides sp. CCNWLW239]|uniref:hypothetical protein n=1 Tax=Nocardioides sp. CCNWLW239 TaxID=3128902 RepID=UPI00301603D6